MKYSLEGTFDGNAFAEVRLNKLEIFLPSEVFNVFLAPGDKIVERHHRVSQGKEPFTQVRTQEARPARYQCSHHALPIVLNVAQPRVRYQPRGGRGGTSSR